MGKICLIAFHDLYLMQFLYKYTEILDENEIEYDVVYWEREKEAKIVRPFNGNIIRYSFQTSYYGSKLAKVKGYLLYIAFVRKVLDKGAYDKAILFTTQAALPMYLFSSKVRKQIRYIYDYRDLTYEKNPVLKKIIKKIIDSSYFTAISSLGFKEVLGDNEKLIMSHNCSEGLVFCPVKKESGEKIRIVYWGMVRQADFNRRLIDLFGNDSRFEVVYHGAGQTEELEKYCDENNFKNIIFTGKYTTDEIPGFVSHTDILMNMYENDGQQKLATTVKLYDGMRYGLPMIVTKGSHMENLMRDQNYVFCLDPQLGNADEVYQWYSHLTKRENAYSEEIRKVQADDDEFKNRLLAFVRM